MCINRSRLGAVLIAFLFPMLTLAASTALTVTDARFTPPPGSVASAYMTITSPQNDTILGASSECCEAVELHRHAMENGVMRMRREPEVALPAATPVMFAPGGLHLMLIGLKKPLTAQDTVAVTLRFAHAAPQTVTFKALQDAPDSPSHH